MIDTLRTAVRDRREASAKVFELTIAGKMEEAFAYSRNVAAKHRQVAIAAVSKLITMNAENMHAARDESVAIADTTRLLLVVGAAVGLIWPSASSAGSRSARFPGRSWRMTDEMTKLAHGDLDIPDRGRRPDRRGRRTCQVARGLQGECDDGAAS